MIPAARRRVAAALAAGAAPLPEIAFVKTVTPGVDTAIPAEAFAPGALLLYVLFRANALGVTPVEDWGPLFPDTVLTSPNWTLAVWSRIAAGEVITDPAGAASGYHRLIEYSGAQVKPGSVSAVLYDAATAEPVVPALALGPGEWGVAGVFGRDAVGNLDAALPPVATHQLSGTGQRRFVRQGNMNLNMAVGDTAGNASGGWAEHGFTWAASSEGLTFSLALEPLGTPA